METLSHGALTWQRRRNVVHANVHCDNSQRGLGGSGVADYDAAA
jgi:hypothetical protein